MKPSVLIISCIDDAHVNAVIRHFDSHDVDYHLLTPEKMLDVSMDIDPVQASGTFLWGNSLVELKSIGAVWYRKPEPVDIQRFSPCLSRDELDFVQAEAQEILDGIYALLNDRYWLTNPPSQRLAARKLLQLRVARQVGFAVPKSTVTNRVSTARQFAVEVDWQVAIKSISWASAMRPDGDALVQYGVYCRRLNRQELEAGIDQAKNAPTLLQEYIPKRCDLRVVAIGREHIFPVAIDSQNGGLSSEDCRLHIRSLPHRLIEIPQLQKPIWAYMDHMNLQFGCFDFAVSESTGEAVFLECNCNGQWLWMETETQAPIAAAVGLGFVRMKDG
jgi:hypothetical protein